MRIRSILSIFLAGILLLLCGCSNVPEDHYDVEEAGKMREDRQVYLTVWSWQITSDEEAQAYAAKAKEYGFTAVDFGILWTKFEPLQDHFEWTYLDQVVKTFTDAGLYVSLQPLFWTKDLSWAHNLALQETKTRKVYEVEGRGSYLSFSDPKTRMILENSLLNFALHASQTYGTNLTRWGVRLSCFGELDYSVNESLDFSGAAAREFYDYLKEIYGTWGNLAEKKNLPIATREDLEAMSLSDISAACPGEWRRFRQESLFRIVDTVTTIYRSVDKTIPILFSLGTFGNGMNTAYSGVVDLWSATAERDVDIIGLSFCDGADPKMMLSLLSSLTTKKIAVEVDGAWALEEGRDISSQVALCGNYGVFSLATANFTLEQLDTHKNTLTGYPALFFTEPSLGERDPGQGILILSNGLAQADPPPSYDALYGDIFQKLSENGARPVRFVTEQQIASGEISLEGVKTLYAGNINGSAPVSLAFAEAFAATETTLYGNVTFTALDGSALPEETASALSARVQAQ